MRRLCPSVVLLLILGGLMTNPDHASRAEPQQKSDFAADRVAAGEPIVIDGKRALGYLKKVCDLGPRVSGTAAMTKQQELLREHFERLGGGVNLQTFSAKQNSRKLPVDMANMIVSWDPNNKRRVILCSHYDTRPIADQEIDPKRWREPFVSANDGGSGIAFLMEFAHHLPKMKLNVGLDFVFFDGEEYIFEPRRDEYFFGSKHFAQTWRKTKTRPDYMAAILLDMIAGPNPRFPAEGYSYARAKPLVESIWRIGAELRCNAFQQRVGQHVQDDHLALQNVGILALDIIDFDYPHWHKLSDVPENCSDEGMDQVGRVLSVWLQRIKN